MPKRNCIIVKPSRAQLESEIASLVIDIDQQKFYIMFPFSSIITVWLSPKLCKPILDTPIFDPLRQVIAYYLRADLQSRLERFYYSPFNSQWRLSHPLNEAALKTAFVEAADQISGMLIELFSTSFPEFLAVLLRYATVDRLLIKIFPTSFYLPKQLMTKINYRQLQENELLEYKHQLEAAKQTLQPYAVRNKRITQGLTGIILFKCLYQIVMFATKNSVSSGLVYFVLFLVMTPMLSSCFSNVGLHAKDYLDHRDVDNKLKELCRKIKNIIAPLRNNIKIVSENKQKTSLSYILINITSNHEKLPRKKLAMLFKITFNQFNVPLISYGPNQLSLSADINLSNRKVAIMQQYFCQTFERLSSIYTLSGQIKGIIKPYSEISFEKHYFKDGEGLISCYFVLHIPLQSSDIKNISIEGVRVDTSQNLLSITIERNNPFGIREVSELDHVFKNFAKDYHKPEEHVAIHKRKGKAPRQPQKSASGRSEDSVSIQREIRWLCGVRYPANRRVKPVSGAIKRFMLFNLPIMAFRGNAEIRKHFKEKSQQMARDKNSQGIKHGSYFGSVFDGRQTFFPARIKLLGDHKDEAVLLDIEKGSNGEILYVTRGFEVGIH
ncbi:MAG: hypothetical protein AMJ43_04860 [Coxiella sp. DG_40]|nr:MAG: hypothetical protein AMJ43_04860 [Coxiella sp. DG_40]